MSEPRRASALDSRSAPEIFIDKEAAFINLEQAGLLLSEHPPMAFRKRNIALTRSPSGEDTSASPSSPSPVPTPVRPPPGVRPSPIDGRLTTSTGTPSLDGVLAGHAGLPLGNSILIGESGTTDYAGALLRFYAAEGVVQGHKVHVVGMGEVWGRELPGIAEDKEDRRKEGKERAEKMKIAWRYEGLGQFESARGALYISTTSNGICLVC